MLAGTREQNPNAKSNDNASRIRAPTQPISVTHFPCAMPSAKCNYVPPKKKVPVETQYNPAMSWEIQIDAQSPPLPPKNKRNGSNTFHINFPKMHTYDVP